MEDVVSTILIQFDDQGFENPTTYMSKSLGETKMKYYVNEKHSYPLVKAIEKFHQFILGKHTKVKVPLPTIKYFPL